MKSRAQKIWDIVSTVLVALVVLFAIALVGVRLFGVQAYAVVSGSMEPVYPTGSLLYVKSVDPKELEVGDAITFLIDDDTAATHRIIEILPDEKDSSVLRFRTQGDANDTPDGEPVHSKNIIGKPIFAIPYLGYVAYFIQHPPGMYIALAVGAILLILVFLPDLFSKEKKSKSTQTHFSPESLASPKIEVPQSAHLDSQTPSDESEHSGESKTPE